MSSEKDDLSEEILDRLDKLTFIGRITNSTVGLVLPFKLAYEEMKYYYPELTEAQLKNILKTANIVILNKPEDLDKYRGKR